MTTRYLRALIFTPLAFASTLACGAGAAPAADPAWYQAPFMLKVGDAPLDIGEPSLGGFFAGLNMASDAGGHAAPFMADLDGDGRRDLVVGSYSGRFRWYRNTGTDAAPKFPKEFTWLKAGEEFAQVNIYCCVASGPQLVDVDGDGVLDLSSGSYDPGALYWFKGLGKGRFASRQILTDATGLPMLASLKTITTTPWDSYMSNLAWADWNDDGQLDVIFGIVTGELFVRKRAEPYGSAVVAMAGQPVFSQMFGSPAIEVKIDGAKAIPDRHAAPAVADWDGDGLWDILVGSERGAVYLLRNSGRRGKPEFKTREILLEEGPGGTEQWVEPGQEAAMKRGIRSQIQAVDYNRDGKLDLLVGTWSTSLTPRTDLTRAERRKLDAARARLEMVDREINFDHKVVRLKSQAYYTKDAELLHPQMQKKSDESFKALLPYLKRYSDATPQNGTGYVYIGDFMQDHGHVWVFLRK